MSAPTLPEVERAISIFEGLSGRDEQIAVAALKLLAASLRRIENRKKRVQDERHRPMKTRIVDHLRRHPGTTERQLADVLGVRQIKIDMIVNALAQKGEIGRAEICGDTRIHYPKGDKYLLHSCI